MVQYFVLFFLFVPVFDEEAHFVRFKGCNGQFDLTCLYECYYLFYFLMPRNH